MSDRVQLPGCLVLLLGGGAILGIVYGLQAARGILVPVLLAVFLALICTGPLLWLERRGVPSAVAVAVVVLMILGMLALMAGIAGSSVDDFVERMPSYQQRLKDDLGALEEKLIPEELPLSGQEILRSIDPGAALGLAGNVLSGLRNAFGNGFLILFTLVFMLFEASYFPEKVRRAFGRSEAIAPFVLFQRKINHYLGLKSLISAVTGLAIWIFLAILGVDFALLWGLVAFLFNYIPNIGSIIAAVPAVLIAYLQQGVATALIVAVGYAVVNVLMGNLIEPRVMGEGMGLSTLVVFLGLVFWGWVFGAVGMLLSVPLTMSVKIALQANPETRRFAVLLGGRPPERRSSERVGGGGEGNRSSGKPAEPAPGGDTAAR